MSSSSPFDKSIKTKLLCDTLTLVGIRPYNRAEAEKEEEREIANRLTRGGFYSKKSQTEDMEVIADFMEQDFRRGDFKRIFPLDFNIEYYSEFLDSNRHRNSMLWNHILSGTLESTVSAKFGNRNEPLSEVESI